MRRRAWQAVMAAGLAGASAGAQVTVPPTVHPGSGAEPEVEALPTLDRALYERLLGELESDDLTTRELATRRLMTLGGLTLGEVEGRLRDPDLGPESRRRLEQVAGELFREHPKGGLGVSFSRTSPVGGVRIETTVDPEHFPAAAILAPGDFVTHIDGQRVRSDDHLRWVILSHEPGDVLHALVQRGGRALELDLPLGDFEDLGNPALLDAVLLQQALRVRLDRQGELPAGEPIGSGLDAEDWAGAAGEVHELASAFVGVQNAVVGGVPRAEPVGRLAGAPIEAVGGVATRRVTNYEVMSGEQRRARYDAFVSERQRLDSRVATYRMLLSDPDLDARERASLIDSLRELTRRLQRVDAEVERLLEVGGFELDAEP